MRRALASIRFSPADRPRLASRSARSRTTSTTWIRSPDASFSRFALYRCDQSRASSPPPNTVTPQPISKFPESLFQGTKARSQDDSDRTHCRDYSGRGHWRDPEFTEQRVAENASGPHAVFTDGGDVAADGQEGGRAVQGTEAAADLGLHLDHADGLLGGVVGERHGEVGGEVQELLAPVAQPQREVAGGGLLPGAGRVGSQGSLEQLVPAPAQVVG